MAANASAISMETNPRPWWLMLIDGFAIAIISAILLWGDFLQKVETYQLLITMLGLWWILRGILDLVSMFVDSTAWGWKLFMGIVSIIAGSYVLSYPLVSAVAVPRVAVFVLGFWGLVNGIALLIMAFRGGGWGAGLLGVLEIVFGAVIMANWASLGSGLALLWTAAIFGVVGGIFMIVQAFRQRSA